LLLPSFIKIARRVNGIVIIAVMIINVRKEVSSIGCPQAGKKGIGKTIRSHIVPSKRSIFHLSFNLERNSIAYSLKAIEKGILIFGTSF
jgi:hypothetical protein